MDIRFKTGNSELVFGGLLWTTSEPWTLIGCQQVNPDVSLAEPELILEADWLRVMSYSATNTASYRVLALATPGNSKYYVETTTCTLYESQTLRLCVKYSRIQNYHILKKQICCFIMQRNHKESLKKFILERVFVYLFLRI